MVKVANFDEVGKPSPPPEFEMVVEKWFLLNQETSEHVFKFKVKPEYVSQEFVRDFVLKAITAGGNTVESTLAVKRWCLESFKISAKDLKTEIAVEVGSETTLVIPGNECVS